MAEQLIRLIYPPSFRRNPIIEKLVRAYNNLTVNILSAEVNDSLSWFEIQLVGSPALIENAIGWLREKGIEVQTLGA